MELGVALNLAAREWDDSESLLRYLLYSNEFNTRGSCAVTSTRLRNATHHEAIRQIITAYGTLSDNLNKHVSPRTTYPVLRDLLSLATSSPSMSFPQKLQD